MILLWGIAEDRPTQLVLEALQRREVEPVFLEQSRLAAAEIELRIAETVEGTLTVDGRRLDLAAVTGAYVRTYDWSASPELRGRGPDDPLWQRMARFNEAMNTWTEVTPARVVNRSAACGSNSAKPYQLRLIREAGFAVPETLVSSDPDEVRRFHARHGALIYKSVSGVRSIVSRLDADRLADLDDIAWCPTQFQRCLPGRDVRVHVVGEQVLACEILSQAVDYRYPDEDQPRPELRARTLPPAIAARCVALARHLDIPFAGVDLRECEDDWYCFEVNPLPGFSYFQLSAGLPIADAVADYLLA